VPSASIQQRALALGAEARALRRAGKNREAAHKLDEAVRLAPQHAGLTGNLGNTLLALGERTRALLLLGRACELDPSSGRLAYNFGTALLDARRFQKARVELEKASRLGGVEAEAHVNLGRLDEIEGNLVRAAEHWQRAAECAPGLARAHYLLARVGHLRDRGPLERILAASETPPSERLEAHFGLGYQLEREQDYTRAFTHFRRGNELKSGLLPRFDARRHRREVERLMRTFTRDFLAAQGGLHTSEQPVFIVGMPRSGTTLVESVCATHPSVQACGERPDIDRLARRLRVRGYPEELMSVAEEELVAAADAYLADADGPQALRLTDKMPGNYVHLGLIARLFRHGRVIHCQRDALDTALSLYCQLFEGSRLAFSYDLVQIAAVLRTYWALMAHWRAVLPLALHELDYEELVSDHETQARQLSAALGLEAAEATGARGSGASVLTASAWRVRGAVDRRSVGRWRLYEAELEPLRRALEGLEPLSK
jgi:tetratricopeptide (TPR) repeat protein